MRQFIPILGILTMICVCGFLLGGSDDSDATGSGTINDPYSDTLNQTTYDYAGGPYTYYVYTGTTITIRPLQIPMGYVSPGHGLTLANGTISGTLTGNNGDTVEVRISPGDDSSEKGYIICVTPSHIATWENWDGTVLTTTTFAHHTIPAYNGTTPTRQSTAQYNYTFSGWSPTPTTADGDVTYTAQYTSTERTYTIIWKDYDGTVLETDTDVPYGTIPTYNSATPTKPATAQYIYTFSGWSPTVGAITGNTTYTAVYSEEWEYTVANNVATIVSYLGSGGAGVDIAIPSAISFNGTDYPVRTVGDGTNNVIPSNIVGRNLVIPNSVYTISANAFKGCSKLTGTLTIGNSVNAIRDRAFYQCGFTGNLSIPDSVTTLGTYVFYRCSGFTGNLVIPDSITTLTMGCFSNCTGLTGTLTIPDSVTWIADSAFSSCGFTGTLAIPDSVIQIRGGAFYNCSGFTGNLIIPDSVTNVGISAFNGCTGFDGNLIISWDTSISSTSFSNCTSLHFPIQFKNYDGTVLQEGFVLYGSVPIYTGTTPTKPGTSAEIYRFNGWDPTPDEIQIPMRYVAQFTAINVFMVVWKDYDGTVLETDTGVEEGTTPTYDGATPTRADMYQFRYTFSGWNPTVGPITGYTEYTAVYTETAIWTFTTENSVATITGYLGSGGAGVDIAIPSVVLDGTECVVRTVGNGTGNVIPVTITGRNLVIPHTVYVIGDSAFAGCSGFTGNLTIPGSISLIDDGAFANCSGFSGTLVIPDSVTYIGDGAFTGCYGFTGLTIGNSVTYIGDIAFAGCFGFTGDLVIPDSVISIGNSAFSGCSGFTGNLIISWDTTLGMDAFIYCTSLHFPIQFKNYDGTVLQEGFVLYGSVPVYTGSTPTKPMDEDYEYDFAGWTPAPVGIKTPTKFTAEFTPLFKYTVTWTNWDDSVLLVERCAENRTPVYTGETPTKPPSVQYTYEFAYWTPAPAPIVGNTVYKAVFTGTLIVYDFGDWQYVLDDDYNAVIAHNIEHEGVLQIPTIADGYAVRSFIGGNMTQATGIVIPTSITAISNNAFSGSGITEVLNLSDLPITGTSYGLNNATVYTSVPGWMYIDDSTYTEKVPDTSARSGLIRIIPILIIIGIIVHILRNRVGNGDE